MSSVVYRVTGPRSATLAMADSLEEAKSRVPEVQRWNAETDEGPWRGVDYSELQDYRIDKFVI